MALPPGARKVLALSGFKKYFANTSWLMVEKIFRSVLLLVVGVYVARYLGPGQFGLLSYAISFVALFSAINTLGLDSIVVRELVKNGNKRDELLGTAFFLKLAGAFSVLAVLYIAVHFTSNDNLTNLLIFIITSSAIFRSFSVIDFYFQSKVLSKYVVYVQLVLLTVSSCIKLFLIWFQAPLLYFAIVFLVDGIILAIGLTIAYLSQKLNIFDWRFKTELAVSLLKNSWPLILSGICLSIYMRIDQVMIKHILDMEAVGQYAAAVRLSEACYFIPVIICGSLFPAVISAKNKSSVFYQARLQKLYNLMVWIAILIALATTLVADDIVKFLFGAEFSKAGPVLTIHIWASVFVFALSVRGKWLLAENLQKYNFYSTLTGSIINIILNIIFIPIYGILGAALATIFARISAFYMIPLVFKNVRASLTCFHIALVSPIRAIVNILIAKKE